MPHRLKLAWRLLLRDWRAGELRILFAALVIAVGATSAIGFFTDRLQRAMGSQSAELLGADLILRAPRPISEAWLKQAEQLGLRHGETLEFPSMVLHGAEMRLAGIKAVADGYPLRGSLRISDAPYGAERDSRRIPPPGEAWAEARLLPLLGMEVGETLALGDIELKVTQIVAFEPGAGGNFAALAPRLLVNHSDVERAGILGVGSRVSRNYLFAGELTALARYKQWLTPQLEPSHRLVDVREDRPTVGAALERAERYLGLASLTAVLLAGVAIAMGARRYSERHFDVSAMLRCLGASQRDILALYLPSRPGCLPCCMSCCRCGCRRPVSCRRCSACSPAWWCWPASPCRRSCACARCRPCACCAATSPPCRYAPGWCTAPPSAP